MSNPPQGKLALPKLAEMKHRGEKIVMVTAYDAPGARFAEDAGIDIFLVGDTAAMVVLGHEGTTVPVTMDEMIFLTRTVARAARRPSATPRPMTNRTLGPGTTMIANDIAANVSSCVVSSTIPASHAGHPLSAEFVETLS